MDVSDHVTRPGEWHLPPRTPVLASDEVHVWLGRLGLPASERRELEALLTADELARAGRYHFEKDRDRYVARRGLLRVILGSYLGTPPGRLRFCCSPHGKPSLTREFRGDTLRFNVSDSDGLVLYALTLGRELGVDLERIDAGMATAEIGERFFSRPEVEKLRGLPEHQRSDAFFRCWTRKEAYVKARGEGLSLPLHRFEVSLAPGAPAALLRTETDPREASRWSLRELPPIEGCSAAICVEGSDWRLDCWRWPDALPV